RSSKLSLLSKGNDGGCCYWPASKPTRLISVSVKTSLVQATRYAMIRKCRLHIQANGRQGYWLKPKSAHPTSSRCECQCSLGRTDMGTMGECLNARGRRENLRAVRYFPPTR